MIERLRSLRDRVSTKAVMSCLGAIATLLPPSKHRPGTIPQDLQFQAQGAFTGLCQVREFTADGYSVGRCDFGTRDNLCPRHGDVGMYLIEDSLSSSVHDYVPLCSWPRDFELPKYDGQTWAEQLRKDPRFR